MGEGAKKQKRGLEALKAGMCGILVTCNERENACVSEAYSILNEYADKLYGPVGHSGKEDAEEGEDVEEALAREKQGMNQDKRFQSFMSGAKNVVFIRTNLPDNAKPLDLVRSIFEDLQKNGKMKSRLCLRFLPVDATCHAKEEDIKKTALSLFEDYFLVENIKPCKFAITFKARNNSNMQRDDVIKLLAGLIGEAGKGHTVDLGNPDWTICVEVIKSVCCLSVVNNYKAFKRYNISELQKSLNPSQSGNSESETLKQLQEQSNGEKDHSTMNNLLNNEKDFSEKTKSAAEISNPEM
ncbi:THUMP domain-containing protein 1 isoform X2 [Nematostella vectensis]|uniref:THUMP domain-containing protein 1 isoform X2 n=1 Tax=Nematostella vectensis TaxID=45351 RepID=UPI002076F9E7|nr:THUMP domain-containing protein 1 isoform X2 [Nematostella vectensis]